MTASVDILDEPSVRSLVSRSDILEAVRQGFAALAEGRVTLPDELAMTVQGGELHVKGAHITGSKWMSFKVATGFPTNLNSNMPVNNGLTVIMDAETGQPVALLMDGGWLTEMRTAAAGALAADLLARPSAGRVAILGAGIQARYQLAALKDVRTLTHVAVWSRTRTRAETLVQELRDEESFEVTLAPSAESGVRDADLIVCATSSTKPIVQPQWLQPGIHITAMGADRRDKRELAAGVIGRADVVVADQVAVSGRVGELHHALESGEIRVEDARDLGDVVLGRVPGRRTDDQITVACLCGIGVQDAAVADLVMSRISLP